MTEVRIVKRPGSFPDARSPLELLVVPMFDLADGWKVRVRGKRADGNEYELVAFGIGAVETTITALKAWRATVLVDRTRKI